MRVAELEGALLDYHVARAEGVPAADLELSANGTLCVRNMPVVGMSLPMELVLDYSTNWALCGPMVEKHHLMLESDMGKKWQASVILHDVDAGPYWGVEEASTAMIAICRAVVRAAFGDEVEDLP